MVAKWVYLPFSTSACYTETIIVAFGSIKGNKKKRMLKIFIFPLTPGKSGLEKQFREAVNNRWQKMEKALSVTNVILRLTNTYSMGLHGKLFIQSVVA